MRSFPIVTGAVEEAELGEKGSALSTLASSLRPDLLDVCVETSGVGDASQCQSGKACRMQGRKWIEANR